MGVAESEVACRLRTDVVPTSNLQASVSSRLGLAALRLRPPPTATRHPPPPLLRRRPSSLVRLSTRLSLPLMMPPVLANGAAKLPSDGAPRPWPETCSVLRRKVARLLSQVSDDDTVLRSTQQRARASMAVIREALQRYWCVVLAVAPRLAEPESFADACPRPTRRRSKELSLSYNGGKDCLVLLILILACLPDPTEPLPAAAQGPAAESPTQGPMELLQAIYIAPPDPFPDVEDFVAVSASHYHLDLMRYSMPMRDALAAYRFDRPPVKAIFMGTRRTDPHSQSLTPFSPTDGDWPSLMRVNPVLDWHYPEIWAVSMPPPLPPRSPCRGDLLPFDFSPRSNRRGCYFD